MTHIFKPNMDNFLFGLNGQVLANGRVHFYNRQSGEYAPIFGDAGGKVPLRQPVQADSGGMLATIYLDDVTDYRVVISDADNNAIREMANPRTQDDGIKLLGGLAELQDYKGNSDLVLVQDEGGCPVFYTRIKSCERPAQDLPNIVHGHGCSAWKRCKNETDICSLDTADLTCDSQVLVQDCAPKVNPDGTPVQSDCHCSDTGAGSPQSGMKKASIGDLLTAAGRCLPRVCIPFDAPEVALGKEGQMIAGDRVPLELKSSAMNGAWGECLQVVLKNDLDKVAHHLQLDSGAVTDVLGDVPKAPSITFTNDGKCRRQYEIRALNRLNRAVEIHPDTTDPINSPFGGVPPLVANLQTRLGKKGAPGVDSLLDATYGVADWENRLNWLVDLSIADSTMGPFMSGHYSYYHDNDTVRAASANTYTENTLIVTLDPGETATFVVKYHIYWDKFATPKQLEAVERVHYGTRIIARPVR